MHRREVARKETIASTGCAEALLANGSLTVGLFSGVIHLLNNGEVATGLADIALGASLYMAIMSEPCTKLRDTVIASVVVLFREVSQRHDMISEFHDVNYFLLAALLIQIAGLIYERSKHPDAQNN